MTEYLVQNWQQSYDQTYLLFEMIKESDFVPDVILGVARGGWIPARLLADFFSLRFTANIKVEAYHLIGEMDVDAKVTQDINASVEGKKVLVVDDIADTGSSLEVVLDNLEDKNLDEVKIATLYYKDKSIITPDYYVEKTNAWVIFAWEIYETIQELSESWKQQGLNQEEIMKKLKMIGLPPSMINSYYQ